MYYPAAEVARLEGAPARELIFLNALDRRRTFIEWQISLCVCLCVCVFVCARARARVCACVCVRARVCVFD